jgi:V/A-type H+/Na+-transporting ATPase subunit D
VPETLPPGRAGRLWLVSRVSSTRRSMELLDRKRQLLLAELARVVGRRARAAADWRAACAEAERWGRRVDALGGATGVDRAGASVAGTASVEIPWRNIMGVVHPGPPACSLPLLDPTQSAAVSAALGPAAAAARDAIAAAAEYGTAEEAHRLLAGELTSTERRHRTLERHRLPALEEALTRLELRLEELEREERVTTRWAQRGR